MAGSCPSRAAPGGVRRRSGGRPFTATRRRPAAWLGGGRRWRQRVSAAVLLMAVAQRVPLQRLYPPDLSNRARHPRPAYASPCRCCPPTRRTMARARAPPPNFARPRARGSCPTFARCRGRRRHAPPASTGGDGRALGGRRPWARGRGGGVTAALCAHGRHGAARGGRADALLKAAAFPTDARAFEGAAAARALAVVAAVAEDDDEGAAAACGALRGWLHKQRRVWPLRPAAGAAARAAMTRAGESAEAVAAAAEQHETRTPPRWPR